MVRLLLVIIILLVVLLLVNTETVSAQEPAEVDTINTRFKSWQGNNYELQWKKTILPASLVAVGSAGLYQNFWRRWSRSSTWWAMSMRNGDPDYRIDDGVQYLPVTGAIALGLAGVESRHCFRDRCIIAGTSWVVAATLVNVNKYIVGEERPEHLSYTAFPSGHTATAFMGAEMLRVEYGGWYGASAYVVATGIGVMRMVNGRHWLHDVVAGAGIGILSARIGEWSMALWDRLLYRNKQSSLAVAPYVSPSRQTHNMSYGIAMNYRF